MEKLLKRKIHDVSTYVIKKFKKPGRECVIVTICMMLLTVLSLSADSGNMELTSMDRTEARYDAPAEFGISETTEEKTEDVLNESRISDEDSSETPVNFETLGSLDAYEAVQLLQTVRTLTEEKEVPHQPDEGTVETKDGALEEEDEALTDLSGEQPETIDVASAQTEDGISSESVDVSESVQGTEELLFTDQDTLASEEIVSETADITVDVEDDSESRTEEILTEEVNTTDEESVSADCAADTAEAGMGGLSPSEYDALCRIVEAEAGTEGEEGKLLVANVVLNRVADPAFPSTIEGVITDSGQFSPVQNGRYQRAVATPETLAAVNRALNGENISKGALYFKSVHSAANWGSKRLLYNYRNHNFYQ